MGKIDETIRNLQHICLECNNYGTSLCIKSKCNVGFSLKLTELMKENDTLVISDGLELLPKEDTKFYDENDIARCIASICKLCKECNERHSEFCAISLARKSIEGTYLNEMMEYPGNVLSYIVNVSKQNPNFAELIMEEFKKSPD